MPQIEPVSIRALPESVEAFKALRDDIAKTPQGGAAMMVVALLVHAGDAALGSQCLALAVDRARLQEGSKGYQGLQLARTAQARIDEQLARQAYLPNSYVRGTKPGDGYKLPGPPYTIEFSYNPRSGDPDAGETKVFVACSGADSPRPVTVRRNEAWLWLASEWSSLVMGIKPAAD